jgi:oligosaccharide repeat unit polymerase
LYLFFILSSFVLLLYINKIGLNNIALLSALDLAENSESINVLRSDMGNASEGIYHWYKLFMRDFLSIASVAFFGFSLLRKNLFYYFVFVISFIICSFSMTMYVEKAPILKYYISLFLIYILIRENGLLKTKNIIFLVFFGFLLLGFVYINFTPSAKLLVGIKNAAGRIFTGEIQPMYFYLEIFPKQIDFLMGRSFPNPGGLMPYDSISLSKTVYAFVFPDKADSGIVGSVPSYYMGEMYANFGYFGIIIPPFFIGFYLYWLNALLVSFKNRTPIFLSIYIWIILHYSELATSSLSKFLIDVKMLIVILFFILIIVAPKRMKLEYFKFSSIKKIK